MPDFATDVFVVMGITLPFATLALVLRLIARRMTRAKYSYDDVLAVMSLVCFHLFWTCCGAETHWCFSLALWPTLP